MEKPLREEIRMSAVKLVNLGRKLVQEASKDIVIF